MKSRNFHEGDLYVRRNLAAADAFSRDARIDVVTRERPHALDPKKTARDLGRVDEGFGPTPANGHRAR